MKHLRVVITRGFRDRAISIFLCNLTKQENFYLICIIYYMYKRALVTYKSKMGNRDKDIVLVLDVPPLVVSVVSKLVAIDVVGVLLVVVVWG